MAIKAHGTDEGTITFSMLNRNGISVVEHTMPIEAALGVLSFVLQVMDDEDMFEDDDQLDEVAGHC